MALEPMPLPPELAGDSPIPDAELAELWETAAALAFSEAIDPDEAARSVLAENDHLMGRQPWHITDLGGAEWAMRHVAEADAELAALQMQRDEWARRIDGWFAQAAGKVQARRGFFATHLQLYAIDQRESTDGKVKSVVVPSGRVQTRSSSPKVTVRDPDAVLEWAEARGVLDQVAPPERKVKLTPLRELVEVVQVVDQARLLLADGQFVDWVRQGFDHVAHGYPTTGEVLFGFPCPQVGDGHYWWRQAPDGTYDPDTDDAPDRTELPHLVAEVEVLCAHTEPQDARAEPVPGCWVDPGGITATVQAEQP